MRYLSSVVLSCIAMICAAAFYGPPAPDASPRPPRYHLLKRVLFDSTNAKFLAVDPEHRRLYGAGLSIFDIDRDQVTGQLPQGSGFGFAIAPELGLGIARRGVLFDLANDSVVARVAASGDFAVYDPMTKRALLVDDTTYVVDLTSRRVVDSMIVTGAPKGGVSDGRGSLYMTLVTVDSMLVLDAKSLHRKAMWSLAPCQHPFGLAIDGRHRVLFASCWNRLLVVVNADNGTIITTVPISGLAESIAFDSSTGLIFSPGGDGTMTIIHEDSPRTYSVTQTVETAEAEGFIAVDPVSHRAYLIHHGHQLTLLIFAPEL